MSAPIVRWGFDMGIAEGTEGTEGGNTNRSTTAFLLVKNGDKVTRLIDSKAAKAVAEHLGDRLAFDPISKSFFVWTGTHWEVSQDTDRTISLVAKIVDKGCGSIGYQQRYLNAIVRQIQLTGALKRPPRPKNVVSFQNGLLDINTGELKRSTPRYSTDWVLPHNYNKSADCDNIKAWLLDAVDEDEPTFRLLRAWIAALVRGLPLQYILMLIGHGGGGKGVFQRLVVATIGEFNQATSTLKSLENNQFEPARHLGKSLCLINEAGSYGGQLNMLKAMSGRDHIPLEFKNKQQNASFVYGGLFLLATNDDIASSDSGIERRRIVVRFSKRVSVNERLDWQKRGGEEAILHTEIPGLINWALQLPVVDIHKSFEDLPKRVVKENLLGMRAGSSVADWVIEECHFDHRVKNQIGKFKANETGRPSRSPPRRHR